MWGVDWNCIAKSIKLNFNIDGSNFEKNSDFGKCGRRAIDLWTSACVVVLRSVRGRRVAQLGWFT